MRNTILIGTIIVIGFLLLVGCESSTMIVDRKPASYDPANCIIEQSRNCFCMHGGELVRLTVRNDSIVSGIFTEDNCQLTPEELNTYLTINDLFSFIETVRNSHPAELDVDYDSLYGYPCHVYVDFNRELADDEIGYTTRWITSDR